MSKRKRASDAPAERGRTRKYRAVSRESMDASGAGAALAHTAAGSVDRSSPPAPHTDVVPEWTARAPVGGRILHIDPLFARDDQFFLVAYAARIKVFARATGLCVRTLNTHAKSTVVALALSLENPEAVYAGLSSGRIELWDWTRGVRTAQWDIGAPIVSLSIAGVQDQSRTEDLVYVVEKGSDKCSVSAHRLSTGASQDGNEVRTLFTHDTEMQSLYVTANGRIAVLHSGKQIFIGTQRGAKTFPLQALRYTWRVFECSGEVTTISTNVTGSKNAGIAPDMDIAVGTSSGVIFVYRDILNALIQAQQTSKSTPPVARYHWHRNAVGALAWSKDGNYVISGGRETVIVLWQLDTNQKSYLPHLGAAIHQISVSPSGSYYGLVLGDNSSLVLSTLDLKPIVRVSEPQLEFEERIFAPSSRNRAPRTTRDVLPYRRPAIDAVRHTSKLVAATPSAITEDAPSTKKPAAPFLQAVDHKSGQEIFRQAITRTNVTDRNIGPEGNRVEEPDVVLMKVSADGLWLATVDEWVPPRNDREHIETGAVPEQSRCPPGLESYLKFWRWGDASQRWELVWRVNLTDEAGHSPYKGMVLDLIEDESCTRFFTLTGDMVVKAWEPRRRLRNGIPVPENGKTRTSSWVNYTVGVLEGDFAHFSNSYLSGRLAVSQDGSVLAACLSETSQSLVALLDLNSRVPIAKQTGLIHGPVFGASIVGNSLVVLADDVLLWDLVNSRWTRILEAASTSLDTHRRKQFKHLALDSRHKVVAIAIPVSEHKTRIAILKPQSQALECTIEIPSLVRALVPSPNREGFVVINANSELQSLASSAVVEEVESTAELPDLFAGSLNRLFAGVGGQVAGQLEGETGTAQLLEAPSQGGNTQLSEVLGRNQPLSMPPLMGLFKQVASVLSRS